VQSIRPATALHQTSGKRQRLYLPSALRIDGQACKALAFKACSTQVKQLHVRGIVKISNPKSFSAFDTSSVNTAVCCRSVDNVLAGLFALDLFAFFNCGMIASAL